MDTFVLFGINRSGLSLLKNFFLLSLSSRITRKFFEFSHFVLDIIVIAIDYNFLSFQDNFPVLFVMLRRAIKRDIAFNPSRARRNPSRLVSFLPFLDSNKY